MVIKWNLLEGYQGLTDLAEGGNEVWKVARNQELAGGLSKEQGLSKVVGRDGQPARHRRHGPGVRPALPPRPESLTEGAGCCREPLAPSPG